MTILTLQYGQCGNQIGHALFTYLASDVEYRCTSLNKSINADYVEKAKSQWFYNSKNHFRPRSILVDTENKVIASLIKGQNLLKYKNVIAKSEGGSANNWAYGYNYTGNILKNDVLGTVRKDVERCDEVVSFLNILGVAGGTGSGLGSCIIEALRDEYPNKVIMNALVLPYSTGEVVTQNYNTILTLAKLHDLTDGSFLFENDLLHKTCKELLAAENVELTNINSLISQKISSVYQPSDENCMLNLSRLTSHPNYKFLTIKTMPHTPEKYMEFETEQKWSTLIRHMRNSLRLTSHNREVTLRANLQINTHAQCCKSVGNLLITRGGISPDYHMFEPLLEDKLYASWVPKSDRLVHSHHPRNLYNVQNFLTLITNDNLITTRIEPILEQAWLLFNNKAYLHQYEKHGSCQTDFEEAFEKLEYVISCYNTL